MNEEREGGRKKVGKEGGNILSRKYAVFELFSIFTKRFIPL